MLPDSSLSGTPSPSPRKRLPTLRRGLIVLAVVLVVAGFAGAFAIVRGAGNSPHLASGPAATATTGMSTITMATTTTTGEPTTTATMAPGLTPVPTATSGKSTQSAADIRVTENQDMRLPCASDPASYTITIYNAGTDTANWHVNVPVDYSGGQIRSQLPDIPRQGPAQWGNPIPQDGSLAPGQTASLVMHVFWKVPCGGASYHATVQLSFPSGASQADIPLTYAGTGPAPYSNVVLVSGNMNITQACPASGSAPPPFTFAIKNTGNFRATNAAVIVPTWATLHVSYDPVEPMNWIYAGQTWTITVSPNVGISCGGAVYQVKVVFTNTDGTEGTITVSDMIN